MLTKRSRQDIIKDILTITANGSKISRIVYGANLNFKIARQYLAIIQKADFIEESKGRFTTTNKGLSYLRQFQILQGMETSTGN